MSFHRVLPLLPSLSNQALRDQWSIQPDALLSSKIMPHEISAATSKEIEPPTPALNSSSSPPSHQSVGRASPSPEDEDEDLEDYKSPALPPPSSLPQTQDPAEEANKKTQLSVSHLDSDTWPGESAKSICLCQPDPKVPRPRNGTYPVYHESNFAPETLSHTRIVESYRSPKIITDKRACLQLSSYTANTTRPLSFSRILGSPILKYQKSLGITGEICRQVTKIIGSFSPT